MARKLLIRVRATIFLKDSFDSKRSFNIGNIFVAKYSHLANPKKTGKLKQIQNYCWRRRLKISKRVSILQEPSHEIYILCGCFSSSCFPLGKFFFGNLFANLYELVYLDSPGKLFNKFVF